MTYAEMLHCVDHTLLKACASWEEICRLCDEAAEYQTASVCVPPCYIKRIRETYPDLTICTVVGFPLGYSVTAAKVCEVREALADGADEIDMVINLTDVKNGEYQKVEDEIRALKEATGDRILKVIIETCYLTEEEKTAMCRAVTNAGADFIKTSTGFSTAGATFDDIRLFAEHVGEGVRMKAAGGIKSFGDAEEFIRLGADRLGTSRIVKLAKAEKAGGQTAPDSDRY